MRQPGWRITAVSLAIIATGGGAAAKTISDADLKQAYRLAAACDANMQTKYKRVRVYKTHACFYGNIDKSLWREFRAVRKARNLRYLVVNSGGGEVTTAIRIGELIEKKRLTLVINKRCHSSCANFLYLANVYKIVLSESVVGWHGVPKIGEQWTTEQKRRFKPIVALSEKFFANRGLSTSIAQYAPVHHANRPEDAENFFQYFLKSRSKGRKDFLWTYGKQVLEEYFNVKKILYHWEPEDKKAFYLRWTARYGTKLLYGDREGAPPLNW